MFAEAGRFAHVRPARVDSVIELGDLYVVPPFGDAHTHSFGSAASIGPVIRLDLRDGIFYALSLTNSIRDKRSAVDSVNTPRSVDVAYADAGLTATLGHPILSAEVSANHIPWDSLGAYHSRLLHSHTAEGDVYFVIDNLRDLETKWPRILASRPDMLKIFLMDIEHFRELRADTATIDDKGLDPSLIPAIVQRAHAAGLRVAAHVETAADVRAAMRAGVDIIAHLPGIAPRAGETLARYELTDADADFAARHRVQFIATAWLAERLAAPKPWLTGAAAEADTAQLERAKWIQRRSLARLLAHGVSVAIGSDLFETAVTEASYLEKLGVYSGTDILNMWSTATPHLIFPRRHIGGLADGYEASLLALRCDPIADFGCVRKIQLRMKQGYLIPDSAIQGK